MNTDIFMMVISLKGFGKDAESVFVAMEMFIREILSKMCSKDLGS
jgi:hypothetical protein